ncbi:MAG TPA: SDR family oxidoreductase [Woeseiaceae bacterium]|nr:SDR family oxidoreductase [Woeseiaceae bacterium]
MATIFDFSSRQVFVFGGTSGINLGIARSFARAGANVAVASRSQDKVDAAVAELVELGSDSRGYSLDVRDPEAVKTALATHSEYAAGIDILISGAAGNFPAFAKDMSANAFKSVIDIDLLGSFNVLSAALPYLVKPGASVINISAPQAYLAMPMQSHVCAAKAGVDMLTRTLALEWGPMGIRINSIAPGPIADTEGFRRLIPNEKIAEQTRRSVPLQRFGASSEIGDAAMFLCSDAAAYISGVVLPVDGGWSVAGASAAALAMAHKPQGK